MSGNREQHTSIGDSEIGFPLRKSMSLGHGVMSIWHRVNKEQLRYELNWVKQKHIGGGSGGQYVTKYLALTVEPRVWSSKAFLLNVNLSWNLKTGTASGHTTTFETCIRPELGRKVTVFDNILPDTTWSIGGNGQYYKVGGVAPLPEGNDLILTITSTLVSSNSQQLSGIMFTET